MQENLVRHRNISLPGRECLRTGRLLALALALAALLPWPGPAVTLEATRPSERPGLPLGADSIFVPGELIPDLPGSSASPLAEPVRLPYWNALPGPVTDYALLTASGEPGREYFLQAQRLPASGFRYVQQAGRGASGLKPWLTLWNMTTGQGVSILLAWSGNWVLEVATVEGRTVVRADTSPTGLAPFSGHGGLPFPGALVSRFTGHWDYGVQPIVRFIRSRLLRDRGPDWPPVQYNTWYAQDEQLREHEVLESARVAAELGCELFTIDAGWYGTGAGWSQDVGHWDENRDRFPSGLAAVFAELRKLGLETGLWLEVESAATATPVGQAHPDWFLRQGERLLSGRSCLDFGNPAARDWASRELLGKISQYGLDYVKLDFNSDLPVAGEALAGEPDPLYGHYKGLVGLWERLRLEHPAVTVENCASGSMRQDAMTAAWTDTHWISDNVENDAALALTLGATALFPAETCSHWTAHPREADPSLDLESQFTVNMMGHFGLSGRIANWSPAVRAVARERIARYKQLRSLLRSADVFHVAPNAALYLDPRTGKAVLFAFQAGKEDLVQTLVPRGLDPSRRYRLEWPAPYGKSELVHGEDLLGLGLTVKFPHRGASVILPIAAE